MRIRISHFLSIKDLDININSPINFIVGQNDAGKSAVMDAIVWCLTGKCRGYDNPEEQKALIRQDAKAGEVSLTLPDGRTATKVLLHSPASPILSIEGQEDQSFFVKHNLYIDAGNILDIPDKNRQGALLRLLLGDRLTADEVNCKLMNYLGLEEPNQEVSRISSVAINMGFHKAHYEASLLCTETKQKIDGFRHIKKPDPNIILDGKAYVITDLDREAVVAGIQNLKAKLRALKSPADKKEARIAELEKELSELKSQLGEPPREGLREDWIEEVDLLTNKKTELLVALEESDQDNEELGSNLKAIEENLESAMKSLEEVEEKEKSYKQTVNKITILEKKLAEARKAYSADSNGQETEKLKKRIASGKALLDAIDSYWADAKKHELAEEIIESKTKELAFYEKLEKALSPDAVPAQVMADVIVKANKLLTVAARHLFPGRSLSITNDGDIVLSGTYAGTLSRSEKYRLSLALQYVLTRLADERILLIDNADVLDASHRMGLVNFLLTVKSDYDVIIVFATSNRAHQSPNPDIRVWWLDKDKIQEIS